jgi:hypothetical protein
MDLAKVMRLFVSAAASAMVIASLETFSCALATWSALPVWTWLVDETWSAPFALLSWGDGSRSAAETSTSTAAGALAMILHDGWTLIGDGIWIFDAAATETFCAAHENYVVETASVELNAEQFAVMSVGVIANGSQTWTFGG